MKSNHDIVLNTCDSALCTYIFLRLQIQICFRFSSYRGINLFFCCCFFCCCCLFFVGVFYFFSFYFLKYFLGGAVDFPVFYCLFVSLKTSTGMS